MSRNGEPITSLALHDAVRTGIEYEALIPGLVPPYEEREAALFGNYTWGAWRMLHYGDRAMGVAHYRLHLLVEMHRSDAVGAEMRRRSQRRSGS